MLPAIPSLTQMSLDLSQGRRRRDCPTVPARPAAFEEALDAAYEALPAEPLTLWPILLAPEEAWPTEPPMSGPRYSISFYQEHQPLETPPPAPGMRLDAQA